MHKLKIYNTNMILMIGEGLLEVHTI